MKKGNLFRLPVFALFCGTKIAFRKIPSRLFQEPTGKDCFASAFGNKASMSALLANLMLTCKYPLMLLWTG